MAFKKDHIETSMNEEYYDFEQFKHKDKFEEFLSNAYLLYVKSHYFPNYVHFDQRTTNLFLINTYEPRGPFFGGPPEYNHAFFH